VKPVDDDTSPAPGDDDSQSTPPPKPSKSAADVAKGGRDASTLKLEKEVAYLRRDLDEHKASSSGFFKKFEEFLKQPSPRPTEPNKGTKPKTFGDELCEFFGF
jgi:hypothetical protein